MNVVMFAVFGDFEEDHNVVLQHLPVDWTKSQMIKSLLDYSLLFCARVLFSWNSTQSRMTQTDAPVIGRAKSANGMTKLKQNIMEV
jgi:hypothetical protein